MSRLPHASGRRCSHADPGFQSDTWARCRCHYGAGPLPRFAKAISRTHRIRPRPPGRTSPGPSARRHCPCSILAFVKQVYGYVGRLIPILTALAGTALLVGLFARTVDLTPHVDESFFFSRQDPQLKADTEIDRMFPDVPQVLITAEGDVRSRAYQDRLRQLTEAITVIPGVRSVESLTH